MDMSVRFPNLELQLDYLPKSFSIFGFEITVYGILIALGMLLGVTFIVLEAKRSNQNQDRYLDVMIVSLIGGVIGARLYYVIFSWSLYKNNIMEIFNARSGGLAIYGGILGGALAAALYCRIRKLSFWQMADTASMGILIGQMIGRWGDLFNRGSFGEYTDSFFAMQLPVSAVRASEVTSRMRENLETVNGITYIQVHPLFLYESFLCLVLLLLLLALRRKKRFQGELFMRYLAGYGLGRFFIEWLRTDKLLVPGTEIGVSLVVSAFLFVFFTITVTVKRTMAKKRAVLQKRRRQKEYEEQEKEQATENTAADGAGKAEQSQPPQPEEAPPAGTSSEEPASADSESKTGAAPEAEKPEEEPEAAAEEEAPLEDTPAARRAGWAPVRPEGAAEGTAEEESGAAPGAAGEESGAAPEAQ